MKLWRSNAYDKDQGQQVSWHASKRAAEKALRDFQKLRAEPTVGPEGVELVDVPTTKAGLIRWLNDNFHSDNG